MKREIAISAGLVAALATAALVRPPRASPAFAPASVAAGTSAVPKGRHGERRVRSAHAKSNHARPGRRPRPSPAVVDVNHADVSVLAKVPGLSEELARRIIAYRELVGRLDSLDDLSDLDGLSETRLASLSRYLVAR